MNDAKAWNKQVDHPLQSWEWGEFRSSMGVSVFRTHGWQLTFHRVPFTHYTIGYFPKGPLPTEKMISILKHVGKEHNAIFIQLEPNVQASPEVSIPSALIPSHHPLFTKYTFVLDLTKSEEELLATMHRKTRYNIKVAQRHGVIVKEDSSEETFNEYLKLQEETTKRQKFYAHTPEYHKAMWKILHDAGIAKLWVAKYNHQILAAWIIFCFNNTIYYPYGASSRSHREVMASYLLLWEIARWAKRHGYTSFDLWGAIGPSPDPHHPWHGFHNFKQGFNPTLVEYIGSYDLVILPVAYNLYRVADTIRWNILRAIKR